MKKETEITFGIIGLGYMASVFCDAINASSYGRIGAVASRSIEKGKSFSERFGVDHYYGTYEDLLNANDLRLDAIYIATPVFNHYDMIQKCLLKKQNVVCEKPITNNSRQLEELIELAKKNNCFLMEGMWTKCLPTYKKAVEWVQKGCIGEIELIRVDFNKKQSFHKHIQQKKGVLLDYGIYAIAFPLGFINSLPNIIEGHHTEAEGVDLNWNIYMESQKKQIYINISSQYKAQSKALVVGSEGSIEFESPFNRTDEVILYDKSEKVVEVCKYNYKSAGYEYEIEEVCRVIAQGGLQSKAVNLDESLTAMRIIDKLR